MGASKNNGTPKSSILIQFSIINHPFWSIPIFGNTHIQISSESSESSESFFPNAAHAANARVGWVVGVAGTGEMVGDVVTGGETASTKGQPATLPPQNFKWVFPKIGVPQNG